MASAPVPKTRKKRARPCDDGDAPQTTFATAVEARAAVKAITHHNTRTRVWFNKRARRFEDPRDGVPLGGIRPTLQTALFPHYLTERNKRSSSSDAVGSLVDKELTRFARTGRLVSTRRTKKTKKPMKPHPLSRQVAARLKKESITLVAAQVPVRDGACATALDLVGWMPTGKLVQVEVKTGMDVGSQSTRAGMCAAPFNHMPNAPLSHAYLQAAWAEEAACASGLPIAASFVVVANHTKACKKNSGRWRPLPKALCTPAARTELRAHVQRARRGTRPAAASTSTIQTATLPWG